MVELQFFCVLNRSIHPASFGYEKAGQASQSSTIQIKSKMEEEPIEYSVVELGCLSNGI